MIDQTNKNKRTIIIVALMSIIPFMIAWGLTESSTFRLPSTNRGDLIEPIITTERSELSGMDAFTVKNIKELSGHWVMLNFISGGICDQLCKDAMHATKQIRLMLNKDLTRVRRALIVMEGKQEASFSSWWEDDLRLLKLQPSKSLLEKIKAYKPEGISNGAIIIMDPLGNLMMHYGADFDPYAVKGDLKKLLRISQIG
ncbi:hypothetical protein BROOK1789C_1837 [Bathymodiolus brooksi thiotrophic gill symbiont]|jgi:hypothetical protein|nr:hypothetical protein BROOK1789B_2171 [Bathymodiolus brooksi thiotrophic gill symbiont]CAB9544630.1 hypothetical protein BROOK1789C_1837 [Bathymodiolus brooksi thiotrophic gill symbiont]SHE20848.1 hypothetical protein BBROOKSOX_765 [Bathymodiolus brooksi thiotrophic gill symbiont]